MKKIALLCLALVLALGALGTAYALWYDDLFIEGTVYTGTFDVEWSQGTPYDDEPAGKDVSYGYCNFDNENDVLFIYIVDAYPCITYTFPIDIHCVGSVPAHFCPLYVFDGNIDPSWVTFPDWSQLQLHEGESAWGNITVHLDNTAEQDTTYWFEAYLLAHQYNEDPCPD
jgi:hypothetical protein